MHTKQTITTPTAITAGAGRQPPTSILFYTPTSFPVDAADNSVAAPRVHFAKDLQVVRSPVLAQHEMVLTCHMAGQAQTPIRRRVKVAHKEVRIRPPVLRRVWTATFGLFEREQIDCGNEPSASVSQTPDRPTALRSPPPLIRKRRKVKDEDVHEGMKTGYAAWDPGEDRGGEALQHLRRR